MSEQTTVSELLLRWQQERRLSAEELCENCPELRDEVQRRIDALCSLEALLGTSTEGTSKASKGATVEDHSVVAVDAPLAGIPGYQVLSVLGRGGMGVVYKARQLKANRVVALKMILARQYATLAQKLRFQIETEAIARLAHPHIVQLYEVGECDGLPFFSLEFCPGGGLDQKLKERLLPIKESAALLVKVARAMHFAHLRGVVHRDLKPANVLLSADGEPKVTDFGLAKRMDADNDISQTGDVMGTPAYMAPEQAAGQTRGIGPAVDVWALGVILYQLLTGQHPFRGNDNFETLRKVQSEEPALPSRLNRRIPRDLETICLKCLHKEPAQRYASAGDLADDLESFQSGRPIRARPVGILERGVKWARRRPAAATVAVLATLLVVLVPLALLREQVHRAEVGLARQAQALALQEAAVQEYHALLNRVRQRGKTRPPGWTGEGLAELERAARLETPAVNRLDLRTEAAACLAGVDARHRLNWGNLHGVEALAFHPDGKTLAVGQLKAAAVIFPVEVYLLDVATGKLLQTLSFPPSPVPDNPIWNQDGCRSCVFSSDGKTLWVGARSGWVHRWELGTEQPARHSWQAHPAEGIALGVSPDGASLYSLASDHHLRKWPREGDRFVAEYQKGPSTGAMAVSPLGDLVACCHPDRIEWLDAQTLQPRRTPFSRGSGRVAFSPDGRLLAVTGDARIRLVDVQTNAVVEELYDPQTGTAHESGIGPLAFNRGGTLLLSASGGDNDRRVRLWDLAGGRLALTLSPGGTFTLGAAFAPNGNGLAVTVDRQVLLHNLGEREETALTAMGAQRLVRLAVPPGTGLLACLAEREPHTDGSWQAEVAVWDAAVQRWQQIQPAPGRWARGGKPLLAVHPQAKAVVCSTSDQQLHIAGLQGDPEGVRVPSGPIEALAFAPDGTRFWAVIDGKQVRSWSWPERKQVTRWQNWDPISGLETLNCLSAGRQRVLAGGRNGVIHQLRSSDGQAEQAWTGPGGPVRSVAQNAEETLAVVGTQTGRVQVHRLASGAKVADLGEHQGSVEVAAFSPDGRWLATGSRDGEVRVFWSDRDEYRPLLSLQTASGPVAALAFGTGGELFLLDGRSRGVRVWRLESLWRRLVQMGLMGDPDP